MSVVAGLAAKQFNLLTADRLRSGFRKILGRQQAGVAQGVVFLLKHQHHRAAIEFKGVDAFHLAAGIKQQHKDPVTQIRTGRGPSFSQQLLQALVESLLVFCQRIRHHQPHLNDLIATAAITL